MFIFAYSETEVYYQTFVESATNTSTIYDTVRKHKVYINKGDILPSYSSPLLNKFFGWSNFFRATVNLAVISDVIQLEKDIPPRNHEGFIDRSSISQFSIDLLHHVRLLFIT